MIWRLNNYVTGASADRVPSSVSIHFTSANLATSLKLDVFGSWASDNDMEDTNVETQLD